MVVVVVVVVVVEVPFGLLTVGGDLCVVGGALSMGGSCSGVWGWRVGLCRDRTSAAFNWSRWNC